MELAITSRGLCSDTLVDKRMNKKVLLRKFASISIVLLLLSACTVSADTPDSPWTDYRRAAALFSQNGSVKEIIDLCRNARKDSRDPVLRSRITFLLGEAYVRIGDFTQAHKELQKVYGHNSEYSTTLADEARLRDGQVYLSENRMDEARALFKMVAGRDENQFLQQEARIILAWEAANGGNWDVCDSLLMEITRYNVLYGEDERVRILQARQAMAEDSSARAIELLKDLKGKMAMSYLGKAYKQSDNPIMAVSVYKKIHYLYQDSPEAEESLLKAAEVFMHADDWLAAKTELERILQDYPTSRYVPRIHFRLGWINLQLDNLDEALREFRFKAPTNLASYFKYMEAEALRRKGTENPKNLKRAINLFSNIASMDLRSPIAPLAQIRAALTEMQMGDSTSAIIRLKQFLNLYPKDRLEAEVKILLALNDPGQAPSNYLNSVIGSNSGGEVFYASFAALQKQDFSARAYQEVISRNSLISRSNDGDETGSWQRTAQLILAESAYFLRHYDLAKQTYERIERGHADDMAEQAALGLAWCQLQSGNLDSAASNFSNLRERFLGSNRIRASFGQATALFHQGYYQKALEIYPKEGQFMEDSTLSAMVTSSLYRIGECNFRLGNYTQAIEEWSTLVQKYPESDLAPSAEFQLAETYFRASHFDKAESAYTLIIDSYSDSPFSAKSTLRRAQCAYNAGSYSEAIERFEAFISSNPSNEDGKAALEGIQLCYYQIGQTDGASDAFQRVIERFPNSDLAADARFRLASGYLQAGDHKAAEDAFKEILTLYPNSTYAKDAQFAYAKSLLAQEKYDTAQLELQRFVKYFPESAQLSEALYLLGVGLFNLKNYLTAIDYFNRVIDEYPDTPFFRYALQNAGRSYEWLNHKDKALNFYQRYLDSFSEDENRENIRLRTAIILAETGQTNEAMARFKKLRATKDPEIAAEASYRLGMMHVESESPQKAVGAFEFAVQSGDKSNYYRLSALAQLGAIYENSGEFKKAIEIYKNLAGSTSEERWVNAALDRITELSPRLSTEQ